jgi:ATPase subunit of ABC transporter with duplicated ATPase domains
MEYPYSRQPTPEDPNRELREAMLAQLEESDRCLKEAAKILAPLEAEAARVLAQAQARREESDCATAPAAESRIAAGIPRLRVVWLRFRAWCGFLNSSTNDPVL